MSDKSRNVTAEQEGDRRTQRTRQALTDALINLLASKHYDAISIKDIVEQANVGRSTFYAHYQTKDDLLKSSFGRMLDMFLQQVAPSETSQGLNLDTTMLFRHAQGHFEIYRTLIWGSGSDLLTKDGHLALSAKIQEHLALFVMEGKESPVPLPVLAYTMAGSLLLLLKWWLDHKMPYSPGQMDEIFQQLVMPGVRDALGLARDQ